MLVGYRDPYSSRFKLEKFWKLDSIKTDYILKMLLYICSSDAKNHRNLQLSKFMWSFRHSWFRQMQSN